MASPVVACGLLLMQLRVLLPLVKPCGAASAIMTGLLWARAKFSTRSCRALDAVEFGTANYTRLQIWDCGNPLGGNQQWRLS